MDEQLNGLEQSQQARRVMLAKWRADRIHDLTLPSGLQVKVRDVTMTDLMFTGKLPQVMIDLAQESAEQGKIKLDLKMLTENAQEFRQLVDTLILLCVVEPQITEKADEDHLSLDEMNGDDRMFIFNWVNREVEQVRSFREAEVEPVAALQPGNGLRKTPKRNHRSAD